MNNKLVIKSSSLFAGITTFLLATYLFQCESLYNVGFLSIIRRSAIIIAALYIIANITRTTVKGYTFRFKSDIVIFLVALYTIAKLYSDYRSGSLTPVSFMEAVDIFLLFVVLKIASQKGILRSAVFPMAIYMLIICIINDIVWMANGFEPLIYGNTIMDTSDIYFIGNKFFVSYYHMICFALLLMIYRGRNKKLWITVLSMLLILVSLGVDCSTAAIGSIFMFILLMIRKTFSPICKKKSAVTAALAFSSLFPFFIGTLLNIGFIQNIITNVLSRTLTLTGRTNIFRSIYQIVSISPIWGNGNATTGIIRDITRAANIQNGLWQTVISYGIVGGALLVSIVFFAVTFSRKNAPSLNFASYVSITLVYTFLFMGSVEITFGTELLMSVAVAYSASMQKRIVPKAAVNVEKVYNQIEKVGLRNV